MALPEKPTGAPDLILAATALGLVIFGLVMVYSASSPLALKKMHDPTYFALRNGIFALGGIAALAVISQLGVEQVRRLGRLAFWVCMGLLVIVLIPHVGSNVNGAQRWINFRLFTLQPSEPFKVALVVYVAHLLAADPQRVQRMKGGLFPLLLVFGLAAAFLMAEPDFGSTMICGAVLMGMVFVAGIPISWIIALLAVSIPAAALGVLMAPYRLRRVTSFLDPWDDPLGSDFQLVQSLLAFGNGGLTGTGLGEGGQKQFYLPEAHTDFIMAVVGEEMGLLAVWLLISLFGMLVWRSFRIARMSQDRFVTLAAAGLGMLFGFQSLANMGVVMGLLPPKGLTLPMVSYGGTSLIISMASVGVLLALSRGTGPVRRSGGAASTSAGG
ncbi:MAG: putative lipid II flippase FtsW [Magnetococcales bacterium]|nr:putative lipid II flippase FtsW [Magnetococcales bacterium]